MFLLDMIQNCSILFSKDHLKHPIGQPNEALEIQTCTVFPYGYGYGSNAIHSNQIIRFHWWIWMEALYNQYISSDGIHWFLGKGDKFEVAQKKPLPIGRLMWKLMKFIHFSKCYWSTHDIRWICSFTPIYFTFAFDISRQNHENISLSQSKACYCIRQSCSFYGMHSIQSLDCQTIQMVQGTLCAIVEPNYRCKHSQSAHCFATHSPYNNGPTDLFFLVSTVLETLILVTGVTIKNHN